MGESYSSDTVHPAACLDRRRETKRIVEMLSPPTCKKGSLGFTCWSGVPKTAPQHSMSVRPMFVSQSLCVLAPPST